MTRTFTVNAGGGEIDSTTAALTLTPTGSTGTIIAATGPVTFGGANNVVVGSTTYATPLITGATAINKVGAGTTTFSTAINVADFPTAPTPINVTAGTLVVTETGTAGPSSGIIGTGT